jgi:hypothetical protein
MGRESEALRASWWLDIMSSISIGFKEVIKSQRSQVAAQLGRTLRDSGDTILVSQTKDFQLK